MPTERRGPICNSQYEGTPYKIIDNGPTDIKDYPNHLKDLEPGTLRNLSLVYGVPEKKPNVISRMFDRRENDAFTQFQNQARLRDAKRDRSVNDRGAVKNFNAAVVVGITLAGIIGLGALGYHVLNSNAEQTQQTDTKVSTPKPRP